MRHLHSHWTSLFTSCLPFLGRSLSQSVLEVTSQLMRNLENLARFYDEGRMVEASLHESTVPKGGKGGDFGQIPADYVVTQMEALTMIYHYCLLDSAGQAGGGASVSQPPPSSSLSPSPSSPLHQQQQQNELLTNLLHVFLSNTDSKSLTTNSLGSVVSVDTLAIARKILLSTLPRLVNTVAVLWKAVGNDR